MTFGVKGLPREFRDWITAFCAANRIDSKHFIEACVIAILNDRVSAENLCRSIEDALRQCDQDLYGRMGPWRDRALRHEVGHWGVWVRFPSNGQSKKEEHVSQTAEVVGQG